MSNGSSNLDDQLVKDLNIDEGLITSAFGIKWNQGTDEFLFSFKLKEAVTNIVTKRSILFIASLLFDPLCLLSPVIMKAKFLLQELWLLKLHWDESVP